MELHESVWGLEAKRVHAYSMCVASKGIRVPWYDFIWNTEVGGNVLHIAEHGFSVEDAESIVCRPLASGASRKTGRPMVLGTTSEGRLAVVVYELIDDVTVYVITAFEVDG